MKKIIFYFFLAACAFLNVPLSAEIDLMHVECARPLQKHFSKILKIAGARKLISTIQKEGPFRIVANKHRLSEQFGAFWDIGRRTICVNLSPRSSEGELIGSILFELHNAAANAKLRHYNQLAEMRGIDRESYVRGIEYIEYENSLKAALIATQGIKMGILPSDARLPTYRNFEEHYRYQIKGGHSAWIAKNYDYLSSF